MPRIVAYLDERHTQNLKDLRENSGKSLSKTISEPIETDYQIKQQSKT